MCGQPLGGFATTGRPPSEPAAGKTFVAKPKSLAVVDQYLQSRCGPVAKYKHGTTEGILLESLLAKPSQAIDSLAEVHRLHRDQNAHLWGHLDHDSVPQKVRLSATRSGGLTPLR